MTRLGISRLAALTTLAGLAALGLTFGTAVPAWAHTRLESSDPAPGARLDTPPQTVRLVFDEPVTKAEGGGVSLRAPSGVETAATDVAVTDTTVTARLAGFGPAGDYTIVYRVIADDGHPYLGELKFTLTEAAAAGAPAGVAAGGPPSTPASGPNQSSSQPAPAAAGGTPAWVWVLVALLVLAAAGSVGSLTLRRRAPVPETPTPGGEVEPSRRDLRADN